jgi:hypothetical protein
MKSNKEINITLKLVDLGLLIALITGIICIQFFFNRPKNNDVTFLNNEEIDSLKAKIDREGAMENYFYREGGIDSARMNTFFEIPQCIVYYKNNHLQILNYDHLKEDSLFTFPDSLIRSIKIFGGTIKDDSIFKKIYSKNNSEFVDVFFKNGLSLDKLPLFDSLAFINCKTTDLTLTRIPRQADKYLSFENIYCKRMFIDSATLSFVNISFSGFPYINGKNDFESQMLYQLMFKRLESQNNQADLKKAKIAYDDTFEANFFYSFFSDYGYKKSKIIWIALYSLLLSILISLFLDYRKLHLLVYPIENLHKKISLKESRKRRLYFTILYMTIIFFSLNIKFENLRFKNKWLVLYFMIVYIWGLICLGFMISFVLAR